MYNFILSTISGDRFTVQWDSVHVTNHETEGEFTFQVSLLRNGTIHFVYRNVCNRIIIERKRGGCILGFHVCFFSPALWQIPLPVSSITDEDHPVEVGLADSFYVDRPIPPNCKQLQNNPRPSSRSQPLDNSGGVEKKAWG